MLGGMILDKVHHGMYAAMHGGIGVVAAEVGAFGSLLIARHMHSVLHKLLYTCVFGCRNRHYRYAQQLLHQVHSYGAMIALKFVHHIQGEHYGHIELYELHGEIEIAFYVGGIHYIDDAVGLFSKDKFARHHFFAGVRRQRIDAGEVGYLGIGIAFDGATLAVDGDAGKIAHMLIAAGQLVEKGGFAAILIACKSKGDDLILRQRMLVLSMVRGSHFTQTGVLGVVFYHFFCLIHLVDIVVGKQFHFYQCSVGKA